MARKPQEDLIFWDEKNQHAVKVTPRGLVVYDSTGEILTREKALNFLRAEKKEAEKSCEYATGETRTNLLQFIRNVDTALARMHVR